MNTKLFCFFFLFSHLSIFAQKNEHLEKTLITAKEDTNKILLLAKLANQYLGTDSSKTKFYTKQGFKLAEKLNFKRGKMLMLNILGDFHQTQGNLALSIEYLIESIQIGEQMGEIVEIANAYFTLASIYTDGLKQYDKALNYALKALELFQSKKNEEGIAKSYNLAAWIYAISNQNLSIALKYSNKAIFFANKLQQDRLFAWCYSARGEIHDRLNQLDSALYYLLKANQFLKKINDKSVLAYNCIIIGNIYLKKRNPDLAYQIYHQAIIHSKEIKANIFLKDAYKGLSNYYVTQNQFEKAYQYHILHTQLKDSLFNEQVAEKINVLQKEFKKEQQEIKIALLQKEKTLAEDRTKFYLIIFSSAFLFMFIILILLIRNIRQRAYSNWLLKEKNDEIAQQAEELQLSNEEITSQRDSLDEKVKERTLTLEKANEKLRDYAFANSHKVRRPVATIMGLVYLYKRNVHSDIMLNIEIIDLIEKTVNELDAVTREINANLEAMDDD